MTNTKVGTRIDGNAAGKNTAAITTVNAGDLVWMTLQVSSTTINATALSSTRIRWRKISNYVGPSPMAMNLATFMGIVQTVGSDTITATFSATIGSTLVQWTGDQFHNDLGLPWCLQGGIYGTSNSGTATTAMTLPALTSVDAGALECGIMVPENTGTNGSTTGYTYPTRDAFTSVSAYNLNTGAGATTPATATCTSGRYVASAAVFTPASPVAMYSFDSAGTTVYDDSGNGKSWTLSNNPTKTASGKNNGGLVSNGGSTPGPQSPVPTQTADRTLMMNMIAPPSVTNYVIEWHVNSINSGAWGFLIVTSNVTVQARNAAGFIRATATRPTDGLWHNYCCTYDSNNNLLSMYLDGVLTNTQTLAAPLRTDADLINWLEITSTSCIIDDVKMWDKCLNTEQIAASAAVAVPNNAPAVVPPGNMFLGY
jgi:hypothetical protein